jgi:hypothetical protein
VTILTVAIRTHSSQTHKSDITQALLRNRLKDIRNISNFKDLGETSMPSTTTQTQVQIPAAPAQSQPLQGDSITQIIIAIAILTKALALLINVIKK